MRGEHFRTSDSVPLAQQLQQQLSRPDYFNRQIDQTYVLLCSPATRVPLEEFHRDEAAAVYGHVFASQPIDELRVAYTIQPQLESVEIYAIPREVEEAILQYYPTARLFASRAMLMERLLRFDEDYRQGNARYLYMCPEEKGFSLFAFKDGHLWLANTFHSDYLIDTLYYTLNIWQTLGFDNRNDHLVLCYQLASDADPLRKALAEYIVNVQTVLHTVIFPNVPLAHEKQVPADLKALLLNRL